MAARGEVQVDTELRTQSLVHFQQWDVTIATRGTKNGSILVCNFRTCQPLLLGSIGPVIAQRLWL